MKKTVAVVSILLAITVMLSACGKKKAAERQIFNTDLSKLVDLGAYTGLTVDTSTAEFAKIYQSQFEQDISVYSLSKKITEGAVEEGDTANIDYEGKKDGVPFEGGTAAGYDLTIGSGTFIPGFEDGLIGVAIGSTVDLNLTFPESYKSAELAGQAVVFTVTVNYVKRDGDVTEEEVYDQMGFASAGAYKKDLERRAVREDLIGQIAASSEIKEIPQEDIDLVYGELVNRYFDDLDSYLDTYGYTEEEFKSEMENNQLRPMLETQILIYAIFDKEGMTLTDEAIDARVEELVEELGRMYSGVTADAVRGSNSDYTLEYETVSGIVYDFLLENNTVK